MSFEGKLIVIEGLEGAGKSTAVDTVVKLLQGVGLPTLTTREPGGTAIGEMLRTILKNADYKPTLDSRTELLLLYAARVQLLHEVIFPALKQGIWVVADRFELSSFAYQGGGRGLNIHFIQRLSEFCLEGFSPDLTLFLNVTPEEGMRRAKQRSQLDRIEQESMDFFHKIHEAYLNAIKDTRSVNIIDASMSLDQVQEAITKCINSYIEKST